MHEISISFNLNAASFFRLETLTSKLGQWNRFGISSISQQCKPFYSVFLYHSTIPFNTKADRVKCRVRISISWLSRHWMNLCFLKAWGNIAFAIFNRAAEHIVTFLGTRMRARQYRITSVNVLSSLLKTKYNKI